MIISRTPLRISFAGGGSDLPAFYRREPGAVVSTAINRYIYINVNRKFDRRIRVSYSLTEIVDSVDALKHELVRETMRLLEVDGGVEITSISDIPSEGTGLGSSSAYTVGLLKALYAYKGQHVDAARLAREACCVELGRCGKAIGKQDQYIAAYGGLQYFEFKPDGSVLADPIICTRQSRESLEEHLILMYTGRTRTAEGILGAQNQSIHNDANIRAVVRDMVALAAELRDALHRNDLTTVGRVLHEGWTLKKRMGNGVSTELIDCWYDRARAHGALGGKITGAGGGGFLLLFVPPDRREAVVRSLPELQPLGFRLEPQGSKIIYVEESE